MLANLHIRMGQATASGYPIRNYKCIKSEPEQQSHQPGVKRTSVTWETIENSSDRRRRY